MSIFAKPDIRRAARSMIRDYGPCAADQAREEARKAREEGRAESEATWYLIEREIRQLQSGGDSGC